MTVILKAASFTMLVTYLGLYSRILGSSQGPNCVGEYFTRGDCGNCAYTFMTFERVFLFMSQPTIM